jgi:DnaJ-class molecular chaperone
VICDACRGRGFVTGVGEWPERCATCGGKGHLTKKKVAEALGVDVGTLKRMERGRSRVKTCERVLEKLSRLP